MELNQLCTKIQVKFDQFRKKHARGFSVPMQKFIRQMQFGILKSGQVQLNEIGRALQEEIALKQTTKRLGSHLGVAGLWQKIADATVRSQRYYLQQCKYLLN